MHLLKWQVQPDARSGSWRSTIRTQRAKAERILADSPSLRREAERALLEGYGRARRNAADETGLALAAFPDQCPFTAEQLLDDDFWPEDGAGA